MRHADDADGNRRHDRADPGSCEQDAAIHARARSGGTAIQMAADTGASGPARSRRPDGSRHGGMMGSAGRGGCRRTGTASRQEGIARTEEHTSELQSLMRISYAVFCIKKTNKKRYNTQ